MLACVRHIWFTRCNHRDNTNDSDSVKGKPARVNASRMPLSNHRLCAVSPLTTMRRTLYRVLNVDKWEVD